DRTGSRLVGAAGRAPCHGQCRLGAAGRWGSPVRCVAGEGGGGARRGRASLAGLTWPLPLTGHEGQSEGPRSTSDRPTVTLGNLEAQSTARRTRRRRADVDFDFGRSPQSVAERMRAKLPWATTPAEPVAALVRAHKAVHSDADAAVLRRA